jgi:hypothetical protein
LDDGKWVCDTVNTGSDAPPPKARLLNGNSLIKMFDTGNFAFGTPGQTSPKNNEKKKKKSKSKKSGTR